MKTIMKKFPFLKEVNVLLGIKILIVQNNMYKKKSSTIAVMFVLLLTCSLISCDNKNNTSQTPSTHVHDYSDVWNHDET